MRLRLIPAIAVTALTLSGCSPAISGISGVTKGVDGQPAALFLSCDYILTHAYLEDGHSDDNVDLGVWTPDEGSSAPPLLALHGSATGWKTTKKWTTEATELMLVAYSDNSSSYTDPVTFTLADVDALSTGQVLTAHGVLSAKQFASWCDDGDQDT